MTFQEQLNQFLTDLGCTAKELSDAAALSGATISRYRTGERIPERGSQQLEKLASGLAALAAARGRAELDRDTVLAALGEALGGDSETPDTLSDNLNALISVLDINLTELSRALNFDTSYLSRIRSGQRRPADLAAFVDGVCRFVVHRFRRSEDRAALAGLIGCAPASAAADAACLAALREWLPNGPLNTSDSLGDFLKKLDDFDLDEYIRAIHFDTLTVPTMPIRLPTSRNYRGLEEMKQGELDFFKATVLSKSREPVLMCSDMPMEDMAADLDFGKKWMFAIAMMLKKGLHLNMIHNIDRPFRELMLGLESWIPLYMTGQVSPYYLKGVQNTVYCHFNYCSGGAALTGECIAGFHDKGKYYLTNRKEELAYYKEKAACLLSRALPLMEIYRSDAAHVYRAFLDADARTGGGRHSILSALPLGTLPEALLTRILRRCGVWERDGAALLAFAAGERARLEAILEHDPVLDEVAELSPEEFARYPAVLSFSGAFYEQELPYTYAEYQEHLRCTQDFAAQHANYTLRLSGAHAFRNIQIVMHEGRWAMISKNKAPVIHFVIRHAKMRDALEHFIVPVVE